jgi:hypothetical protein
VTPPLATEGGLFTSSPFSVVASPATAGCWAGRPALKQELARMCRSWGRRADTTVDLFWANLGAGKTHALNHLKYLLLSGRAYAFERDPVISIVEMPQDLKSFHQFYQGIAESLPHQDLMEAALSAEGLSANMQRAARAYLSGGPAAADVVRDWLTGRRPLLKDLRSISGIGTRIETDIDAEHALSDLFALAASQQRRVVLMLDEFQRVSTLPSRVREGVLSHLRGTISKCGGYLSVVVAVGTRAEQTAMQLLPPEFRTIMGVRPAISLPAMSEEDAVSFLRQRLTWFRPVGYAGDSLAPFSAQTVKTAIHLLHGRSASHVSPRMLLQTFGILYDLTLDEAEALTSEAVEKCLSGLRLEDG